MQIEARLYTDNRLVVIEIESGLIVQVREKADLRRSESQNLLVAPGLVDNQVNGYAGVDFTALGLTVEAVRKVTRALWQHGVTTYLPTLITAEKARLQENFSVLARVQADPEIGLSLPGFHLEGPYISPEDGYRGAHPKAWVRPPDWPEFLELNRAAQNKIRQITLAPELPGALDFIRNCVKAGIVVAMGHHNASAQTIQKAVDAGVVISTHLGNACANQIHRHKNPLWPQLAEDRLHASLIVDDCHLRPEEVQVFFKVKGPQRIVLISDATMLAGMPAGEYEWNGQKIELTANGMIKLPEQNVQAGASLPLHRGVINLMKFTHCSLTDAIHAASKNPAVLNRLPDRGEIKTGLRADLILFTLEKGEIKIHKTIVAGRVVYDARKLPADKSDLINENEL
ncbi:MAG: N-acetylglucosamine-6-phosphate deacetylase [bacterium]